MPRSAWFALGAILAAVIATSWSLSAAVLLLAAAGVGSLVLARRPWLTWTAIAAALVLVRGAAGALDPTPPSATVAPSGSDDWDHTDVVF